MKYGRNQAILKAVILSTAGDRKPEGVGKITRYLSDAFFIWVMGMAKEYAKAFYNSKAWQQAREMALMRDRYMCQCDGCTNVAEEVHHKIEITEKNINDVKVTLNQDNLISLCSECHKRITKEAHRKQKKILQAITFDEKGYPIAIPPG